MEIIQMLRKLKPKTGHVVFMTTDDTKFENAHKSLYANGFVSTGRVFTKGDKRVSVIMAGTPYEGATNFSLVHFSWYSDLGNDAESLRRVRQWETKATEILTR